MSVYVERGGEGWVVGIGLVGYFCLLLWCIRAELLDHMLARPILPQPHDKDEMGAIDLRTVTSLVKAPNDNALLLDIVTADK